MTTLLIQTVLCVLAGFALWKMWRVVDRDERLVRLIVFAGFISRAVAGTILFWISYLNIPILSRLQMGNGHWFFATDGRRYLREAIQIAEGGLPTIVMHHRTGASVSYVQTLAVSTMLFGNAASVGVLINLFAYMGICLIIVKWRREVAAAGTPGLIALAAICLSPSAILWSTQPLKDTLFQFLIVSIIAAGALWQRAWRERPATGAIVTAAAIMIAALFMAAGIRWYFGFVTLVASGLFFLLTALYARARWKAALAGMVTLFLLAQALVISASAYLPPYLQQLLAPWKPTRTVMAESLSTRVVSDLKEVRRGFENTGGATSIGVAGPLARMDEGRRIVPAAAPVTDDDFKRLQEKKETKSAAPAQALTVAATPPPASSQATETVASPAAAEAPKTAAAEPAVPAATPAVTAPVPAVAVHPHPAPVKTAEAKPSPQVPAPNQSSPKVPAPVKTAEAKPSPQMPAPNQSSPRVPAPVKTAEAKPAPQQSSPAAPAVVSTATAEPAPPARPATIAEPVAATVTTEPVPAKVAAPAPVRIARRTPARVNAPAPARARTPAPAKAGTPAPSTVTAPPVTPAPIPAEPAPVPVATTTTQAPPPPPVTAAEDDMGDGEIIVPTSTFGRLVAGAVAVLLPSALARKFGLIEMGGGRGFMWFTDIDTFVFDAVLIVAVYFIFRRARRASFRNPVFWFVVLVAAVVVPLAYTVTNYGTLFRLRVMVYVAIALIPLALSMWIPASSEEGAPSDAEPPAASA